MTDAPAHGSTCPRVGVGVLLIDTSGRVLLTRRNLAPEAGCWSIVGGKLDYLETLEECAIREAREEVGLQIALDGLLCITNHLVPKERQHWVSPAFLGGYPQEKLEIASPRKPARYTGFRSTNFPRT